MTEKLVENEFNVGCLPDGKEQYLVTGGGKIS